MSNSGKLLLEECSSEATPLKQARLDGLQGVIWWAKKSRVKATISSLVIKSASWTIEPRKRDLKILGSPDQTRFYMKRAKTEVHFRSPYLHVCLIFPMQLFSMLVYVARVILSAAWGFSDRGGETTRRKGGMSAYVASAQWTLQNYKLTSHRPEQGITTVCKTYETLHPNKPPIPTSTSERF